MKEFKGRAIVPGNATYEAVVTKNGFNTLASMQMMNLQPKTKCNDQSNPDLYKQIIEKKALCLPLTIGSTTGGMFLFAAVKEGKAPACLLFSQTIDSLAAAGAVLASWLGIFQEMSGGEECEYVIIDDLGEADFNEDQQDHLVSVDSFYGLDEDACRRAVAILGGGVDDEESPDEQEDYLKETIDYLKELPRSVREGCIKAKK